MSRIMVEDVKYKLHELDSILKKKYRQGSKKMDCRTYEQFFFEGVKAVMLDIDPLVNEASSTVHIINGSCQPHSLSIEQHIKLFLA